MDSKNQKHSIEFLASQQLKKMIPQLLLSVSLFSFVFSYSSLYSYSSSLLYNTPKFHYFSANSFQLLSHALNKNYLFLVCNGLLVFLAKTSGFIQPPMTGNDLDDGLQKTMQTAIERYVPEESGLEMREKEEEEEKRENERPKEVSIFIAESEEEGEGCELEDDEERDGTRDESRSCWLFDDDGDEQQLYGDEAEEEEEEEREEEEREEMSTEELNQKFEDFIRRMKEEIMLNEARQKVVMVK